MTRRTPISDRTLLAALDAARKRIAALEAEVARLRLSRGAHLRTHGMTNTPTYHTWANMLRRCADPKDANYGGRGITVCTEWRHSFAAFFADMGARPSPRHRLDRTDNDGNYEPGNCRWVTHRENCNNRRTTVFITLDGVRLPLQSWAKKLGISARTLRARRRLGWSDRAILTVRINEYRGPDSGRPR